MRTISKRVLVTNAFGTLGYGLTIFAWLLFIGVLFLLLWQDSSFYTPPNQIVPGSALSPNDTSVSGLATGIGYVVAAVMALISLGIIVVLPYFVGKISSKWLKLAMKHMKITASKRHLFLMKCCIAALPLLGFFVVSLLYNGIDLTIAIVHVVTVMSGVLAMFMFFIQLLLARSFKVAYTRLW